MHVLGEGQRRTERISNTEPDAGLYLMTLKSYPELKLRVRHLTR